MQHIKFTFWGIFLVLTVLWLIEEPHVYETTTFFALRGTMVQYSGIIAMASMSVAMVLALRPRWPERWFGGLDKMYRLHKWLGGVDEFEPVSCGSNMNHADEALGELVVSSSNGAVDFQSAKHPFD
ncbi:Uncharacterised protein [Brucella anthropi]|nr:ferric reductase like transmembrane component family protein [Brucella anthropi]SUB55996.1 Uncharacterised protein [Brucella anthropi]